MFFVGWGSGKVGGGGTTVILPQCSMKSGDLVLFPRYSEDLIYLLFDHIKGCDRFTCPKILSLLPYQYSVLIGPGDSLVCLPVNWTLWERCNSSLVFYLKTIQVVEPKDPHRRCHWGVTRSFESFNFFCVLLLSTTEHFRM